MSAIVTLSRQLTYYQQLQFHHHQDIAQYLAQVQQWQKQRMKHMHQPLFSQCSYQALSSFLLDRLYNRHDLMALAKQLEKALAEKIKLERFLPATVLEAAISAFKLAYLTLKLDEHIAIYLRDQGISILDDSALNDDTLHQAMLALQQNKARQQQLILLKQLSHALNSHSRNFLSQGAFRLARRTAYRREFNTLYDYLAEGFAAMRSTSSSSSSDFFDAFIAGEQQLLHDIYQGHPAPFKQNWQLEQA